MLLDNAIGLFTQFILPQQCLLCAQRLRQRDLICQPCQELLPILTHQCKKCAHSMQISSLEQPLCVHCLKNDPYFDHVYAAFSYQPPIIQFIQGLKFSKKFIYGRALAQLMLKNYLANQPSNSSLPDLIIPVPLHPSRQKIRGFNQALELALPIAKAIQRPIDYKSLYRKKATQAQAQQHHKDRYTNLKNAFASNSRFDGRHLLLIDDVLTSGQTVNELAKTAKQSGAKRVDILCAARAG